MNVGGPAVQISGLMRELSPKKFDHRLFTGFCGPGEADYLETAAPDLVASRIKGLGRRINFADDLQALMNLVGEIRKFKPHIIHTHTAKAGFLGRLASILSFHRSIRVHTFHGHLLNGYFGVYKKSLVILAEKVLAIFTDQLLAVGDKVRHDLLKAGIGYPHKFELMPPGLELNEFPNKRDALAIHGLSSAVLQCAFIGRVTQIKRPDRFLDVVAEVKKRRIQIEFLMAGDGELLGACRERITTEELPVKILGWQSNMERVLAASDFVILTSDNEGTPLSLIQAGMAALPVVTTNVGSIPEVVIDGVTGIVTNVDVMELADALEKLAGDVGLRARMGSAAQEFTMAKFGVNRLVYDHEELYKRLISNRAKS
jgi:glycosyltransferase involved in cell wall biosynthesis